MQVTYDLPPDLVSAIEGRAAQEHVSVDEFVAERLRESVTTELVRARITAYVKGGMCDAEIAEQMRYTPRRVASIRRSLGLRPNRRYPSGE